MVLKQSPRKKGPDINNATGWSVYTSKGHTESDNLATCLAEAAITNLHVEGIIEYLQGNI